ncbi:MAG: MATE family efflux transporter, partial [Saprospiraceae bacterium]|nr:MATE family efflux transporter [Saprospiraceae bacterium]
MNREILRLAIPNILSNLSIPLLSTVDTALMGRLSEVHIGAVGLASMIFNFVYWNFGFLRMGTTGITAQFFGRDERDGIILTLARAALVAVGLGLLLLLVQWPLREAASYLMQVDAQAYPHVATYFNIRIWAAPATLLIYAMMGWFFG